MTTLTAGGKPFGIGETTVPENSMLYDRYKNLILSDMVDDITDVIKSFKEEEWTEYEVAELLTELADVQGNFPGLSKPESIKLIKECMEIIKKEE